MFQTHITKDEKGQALVLMVLLLVVLLGFAALALDGGNIYTEQRSAQAAADNAVMAAAYTRMTGTTEYAALRQAALDLAAANGYVADDLTTWIEVQSPPNSGVYAGNTEYIAVTITRTVPTALAHFVYRGPWQVTVRAVARGVISAPTGGGTTIFGGSTTCQNTVDWSGSDNQVEGGVHSNNDIKVSGQTNIITGTTTYVTSVDTAPDKIDYVPAEGNPTAVAVRPYPVDYPMVDYAPGGAKAVAAAAAGQYFACDCKLDMGELKSRGWYDESTRTLRTGLYYTTGQITLSDSSIGGNVTLVARKEISLSGSEQFLFPYVDGLLLYTDFDVRTVSSGQAFCNTFVTKMSGSTHTWRGIIFAPNGMIEMSGSSNETIHGALIGNTVKLNGSHLRLAYDPDLFPVAPGFTQLVE